MKVIRKELLVSTLVVLVLARAAADSPLPPNPHQSMNAAESCDECHTYYGGTPEPHGFFVAIPEKCLECHSEDKLGRSHPVGVDPSRSAGDIDVPKELPLEDGKVSCGSCHNPHMAFLSKTRAFPKQVVTFRRTEGGGATSWYKTFFLRMSDPKKGFEPLCRACHKDY